MKNNKILVLAFGLVTMLFVNSCVEDDDYTVPEVLVPSVDFASLGTKTTFASVISRYEDALADGDNVGNWEFDAPLYIEGYVVSSDAAGNFFEEIIVQNTTDENDLADDPRRGFKVEINVRDVGNFFNYGRKVYIKLNDLAVGESNGVLTLGKDIGNSLGQLEPYEYTDYVIRDPEVFTITPKMVSIPDLSSEDENTLIQISDAQFVKSAVQNTNTYAGEASDQFDGFRTIESCETNATIILQTSTFADFKSFPLAPGRGTITGVYSRDFGDDFSVLIVRDTSAIDFTNPDRCDPIELDCGIAASQGTSNLFEDDFEGQTTNSLISGNGWTNYIQAGSEGWEAYSSGGNNPSIGISARIGAFNSNDNSNIGWLITPQIDFDAQDNETLVFQTSNSFSDNSTLELLFSTDWDGTEANITTANWGVLPAAYIVQDSDFFGSWFDSGVVDLSCAEGNMYIAFKYSGGDVNDFTGTYELEGVSVDFTP